MMPRNGCCMLLLLAVAVAVSDAWWVNKPKRRLPAAPPSPATCQSCDVTPCTGALCDAFSQPEPKTGCRNNCAQCKAEFFFTTDTKKRTINCNMAKCEENCSGRTCRSQRYLCSSDADCKHGLTCCKSCCGTACQKVGNPGPDFVHPGNCPQSKHYPENCPAFDATKHCHTDGDCTGKFLKCCSNQHGCNTCKRITLLGMKPWTPSFVPKLPDWIPQKP